MAKLKNGGLSPSKKITYCAVAAALLIAVQLALYAAQGVELVTVFLLCFSYSFGIWCGVLTALSFSLLRCILFGFTPSVVILYLIYFPLFALIFACAGKIGDNFFAERNAWFAIILNGVLLTLAAGCAYLALTGIIEIAPATDLRIKVFFWVLFAMFLGMAVAFDGAAILIKGAIKKAGALKLIFITGIAALCTICFTMLDNLIAPPILGLTAEGASGYFFASFTSMLPQTVCTIVSVSLLFYPLTAAFSRISR